MSNQQDGQPENVESKGDQVQAYSNLSASPLPLQLDPHLAYMPLRSYGVMMALAFLYPVHFFFVRKVGLGIAFWATVLIGWILLYIPHLIWWFVNLFLVKR